MTRKRAAFFSIMAVFVLLAGCGRQPTNNPSDGGGFDTFVYDTGVPLDGMPDGTPPCVPDCDKICSLQVDCGMIPAGDHADCVKQCNADPNSAENVCLGQLACAPNPDCAAAQKCKSAPQAPDLTITHKASSPTTGQIAYSASVCNKGNGPAGSFVVHFYQNKSNPPVAGEKGDQMVKVSGLAPGKCTTVTAADTGLASGTYTTWAQADAEGYVAETDETNNVSKPVPVKVTGTALDKPDLVVSNLLVQVSASAGTATYLATVCNNGKGASAGTSLDIYVHSPSAPALSKAGDTTLVVSALAAGACASLKYATKLTSGKTYLSWARVDRLNSIAESKEGNNRFGPVKFTVGGTTKKPDLVVTALAPTTTTTSGAVFKATVCNQGTASSGKTSYLRLYANLAATPTKNTAYTKRVGIAALATSACKSLTWSVNAKAGTYKAWAWIDAEALVSESSENNNTYGPVVWTVQGALKPDLTVLTLAGSASSAGKVAYKATVCNKGLGASGKTSYLGIYINRSSAPTTANSADGQVALASLAAGACKTVSWTSKVLKAGSYASWALADRTNVVAETAEGNNYYGPVKVTVSGPAPQPDLYIASMNANPSGSSTGYYYYQVSVCNKGQASSSYATLELYLNRSSKPTATTQGNYTTTVSNLAPGACQTRSFSAVLSPGTYNSWTYIDRSKVVAESNENNNIYGPLKIKVPGTGKPDLQVINVSTSTNASNGYTYYYMTVCNKGTAVAGNAYIDLYYHLNTAPDGSKPGNHSTYVGTLQAGACSTRTGYTTLPGGTYKSWVYVDRTNVVNESNEKNNYYGPVTVKVSGTGKPDLQITNVSTGPYSGSYTMYYVTVCNKGNATAGYSRIDLYYNRTTKPTINDVGERYTSTSTLTAGACTTRNIYATLGPGTYTSWLWVDRTNAVLESKENNNMYGPVKVTVGSTASVDLVVSSLKASANAAGTVTYYANVCNNGTSTSTATRVDLYYNSSYTPSQSQAGNTSIYVGALAAKGCSTVTRNATLSNGTYTSWARVDRRNLISETNENNNVFGPVTVTVGSTSNMCSTICSVLINTCKTLPPAQLAVCLGACGGLTTAKQQCAYKAAIAKNCTAIIQCL